jgi:hypothetical protein
MVGPRSWQDFQRPVPLKCGECRKTKAMVTLAPEDIMTTFLWHFCICAVALASNKNVRGHIEDNSTGNSTVYNKTLRRFWR